MPKVCWKISRKSLLRKDYKQRQCKKIPDKPNTVALKKLVKVILQMEATEQ